MSIIDVFDRAIVAYLIGLSCEAKHLIQITQEASALDKAEKPTIRSDKRSNSLLATCLKMPATSLA